MSSHTIFTYNPRAVLAGDIQQKIENYVNAHSEKTPYHSPIFLNVVPDVFGHAFVIICAVKNNNVVGVLPVVMTNSKIFGKYATSLPYFNYGGVLADTDEITKDLVDEAVSYAKECGFKRFQLRSRHEYSDDTALLNQTKVNMLLTLPEDIKLIGEGNAKKRAKLRSQAQLAVRKSNEENLSLRQSFGGVELLNDFYKVFSEHMRDLGTPVYGKSFFAEMLKRAPNTHSITVSYLDSKPVSCGFLIRNGDTMEIPWASTLRRVHYLSMNANFYWNILDFAINSGVKIFDFGRSTIDEGTYKFKKQWGAQPEQCFWYTWNFGDEPQGDLHPKNPKFKLAIEIWKRLPLFVANIIGPMVAKSLP